MCVACWSEWKEIRHTHTHTQTHLTQTQALSDFNQLQTIDALVAQSRRQISATATVTWLLPPCDNWRLEAAAAAAARCLLQPPR